VSRTNGLEVSLVYVSNPFLHTISPHQNYCVSSYLSSQIYTFIDLRLTQTKVVKTEQRTIGVFSTKLLQKYLSRVCPRLSGPDGHLLPSPGRQKGNFCSIETTLFQQYGAFLQSYAFCSSGLRFAIRLEGFQHSDFRFPCSECCTCVPIGRGIGIHHRGSDTRDQALESRFCDPNAEDGRCSDMA
jgi:hypothetical protein